MSDSNRFGPISKTDQTAIAPVEDGATASKAYAIGSHFMRDGQYCTAIAAIAQGASFSLNTNYTVGDVQDDIFDLGSRVKTLENYVISGSTATPTNSTGGGGTIILYKYGRLVVASMQGTFNSIGTTYTKICNLPDNFLPLNNIYHESWSSFSAASYVILISRAAKSISVARQQTTGNLSIYTNIVYLSAL